MHIPESEHAQQLEVCKHPGLPKTRTQEGRGSGRQIRDDFFNGPGWQMRGEFSKGPSWASKRKMTFPTGRDGLTKEK